MSENVKVASERRSPSIENRLVSPPAARTRMGVRTAATARKKKNALESTLFASSTSPEERASAM